MNKVLLIIAGLLTIGLLLTSCSKDNIFKEPSQVGVCFALNSGGVGGSDRLALSNGYVILGSMELEGERKRGASFHFKRTFPTGLRLDFNATNRVEDLLFDLPQGEYEKLTVRFSTLAQTGNPCLLVGGNYAYRQAASGSSWVDISWESSKSFECIVTTTQGTPIFTLDENSKMITLSIQPKLWFQNISEIKLEQAYCTTQPRGQVMLINQNNNNNMFQTIDVELGTTLKATL